MPDYTYHLSQGDAGITIGATLRDQDGLAVDLTGAAVRWKTMSGDGTETLDVVATIEDAAAGEVSYTYTGPNLAGSGLFYGQWEVTFAGGAVQTFPNDRYATVNILPEVA